MNFLSTEDGVSTQLALWGYAVTGDICERSAVIAEDQNVVAIVPDAWDRARSWLRAQLVSHGDEPAHHPDEWWCLPAVTELLLRRGYYPPPRCRRGRATRAALASIRAPLDQPQETP